MMRFLAAILVVLVGALGLLAASGLAPAPAFADEGAPAQERLTAQELEHLRRNVPDWDDLPNERRERIAKNVVRIRALTPDERSRFLRRIDRFRREDAASRARLPERLARLGEKPREAVRLHARGAMAVARTVWKDLPDDARREGLRPAALGFAVYRAILQRASEESVRSGDALRHVPTPEVRARYEALKARVEAAGSDPGARERETRALAWFVVEDRARKAVRDAPDEPAAGAALREAFPTAYRATLDDLSQRLRSGPEDVRRFLQQFGPRAGDGAKPEGVRGAAITLVRFLEQAGPWLQSHPEAREKADRLLEEVAVRGLGVPPALWDRLPGWDRPVERLRAVKRLLYGARPKFH
jgi:hypothetical protein